MNIHNDDRTVAARLAVTDAVNFAYLLRQGRCSHAMAKAAYEVALEACGEADTKTRAALLPFLTKCREALAA